MIRLGYLALLAGNWVQDWVQRPGRTCLLLAQSRHARVQCTCPLSGVEQTSISIAELTVSLRAAPNRARTPAEFALMPLRGFQRA
jgi:hypothetical protein